MGSGRRAAVGIALALALAASVSAQQQPQPPAGVEESVDGGRALIVGTRHVPPFAIRDADGEWTGISIDLWREVAERLELRYELRELALKPLLQAVADGSVDVVAGALTATAEREKAFDFAHPFHTSGLGIAVPDQTDGGWWPALRRFFSWGFLEVVAGLALLLFAVGAIVWLLERKRNAEQFGGGVLGGLWSGFWWSAVTMTTVGYGDKAPVTAAGRLVAISWMFAGIILISVFTAAMTTALTVSTLDTPITGPADLHKVAVGTVSGSTSEGYLEEHRIPAVAYESLEEALRSAAKGTVGAVVFDAPVLRYACNAEYRGVLSVLPSRFERQDYAFAVPQGSALREPISYAILSITHADTWQDVLFRYLGQE